MLDLTAFLLARIAEDETIAKSAADDEHLLQSLRPIADLVALPGGEILHIVRWDPARVLAECEAKKNLVNYAAYMLKAWDDKHNNRASAWPDMTRRERHTANVILETLAQPYADHPDFDESWRVE